MMDAGEKHSAIAWFIAGYFRRLPGEDVSRSDVEEAMREAERALSERANGTCLLCGREGVVILDGYFCERCYPGIEEEFDL